MSDIYTNLNFKYIFALTNFINQYNENTELDQQIDESHGLLHALMVLHHASNAIVSYNFENPDNLILENDILNIKLASLLHDVDDSKYFPDNHNYENARMILETCSISLDNIDNIVLISASRDGRLHIWNMN
jgi:hypothetical protein